MNTRYKLSLKYGIIFSFVFFLENFLELLLGVENIIISDILAKITKLLVGIFLSVLIFRAIRNVDNSPSFQNVFSPIFILWLVATFISTVFDYVFYNYLFSDFALELKEYSLQKLSNIDYVDSESLEKSRMMLEEMNIFSLKSFAKGFLLSIPMVAILCLVISFVLRRNIVK